jgi:hypothetical protein
MMNYADFRYGNYLTAKRYLPDGGLGAPDDEPVEGLLRGVLGSCSFGELDECAALESK